jgi:hypothetical protein
MNPATMCRTTEGNRIPVERPDFKSGGTRMACLVGSTPTPFRHNQRRRDRGGQRLGNSGNSDSRSALYCLSASVTVSEPGGTAFCR